MQHEGCIEVPIRRVNLCRPAKARSCMCTNVVLLRCCMWLDYQRAAVPSIRPFSPSVLAVPQTAGPQRAHHIWIPEERHLHMEMHPAEKAARLPIRLALGTAPPQPPTPLTPRGLHETRLGRGMLRCIRRRAGGNGAHGG